MRRIVWAASAALLLGCAAYAADKGYTPDEQKRLDKALAGRVAGKPVSCVNTRDLGGNEGFGTDLILFKGKFSKDPIYANRPVGGCARFDRSSAIRFRIPSTRLCRGDIIEVFDPVTHITYGSCGLNDFVPYNKAG